MRGSIAKSLRRKAREAVEVRGFHKKRKYMRARSEDNPDETYIVVDSKSERGLYKKLKQEIKGNGKRG